MQSLASTRVLVIGGTSGIGRATAEAAIAHGARVTVASRSSEKIHRARSQLAGLAEAIEIDAGSEDSIRSAMEARPAWDHVVFSAGGVRAGEIRSRPVDAAIASVDVKLWGAYRVAALAPINPGGSLTFISGVIGARPQAGKVLSGVANAGIEALARGLAVEWAPTRVNVVSPGIIATPAYDTMSEERRDTLFDAVAARLPVGHVGQADDVAGLVLQCMANPFLTGSVLLVDGGHALG